MNITFKADIFTPAFEIETGGIAIKPGVVFDSGDQTNPFVILPKKLAAGADYSIFERDGDLVAETARIPGEVGGFHVGLDGAIVPASIWDTKFRPAAPDPRGMVFVSGVGWVDIYLTADDGTSRPGAKIARDISWWDATALLAAQGKQLLSAGEFSVAAAGVTEGETCGERPDLTAHVDGLRSAVGLEQATGCMWTWTRDIDTDRCALLSGGYWGPSDAGPRRLNYGDASDSHDSIGARGRCDHLILA
jgi:hypothetical protein